MNISSKGQQDMQQSEQEDRTDVKNRLEILQEHKMDSEIDDSSKSMADLTI